MQRNAKKSTPQPLRLTLFGQIFDINENLCDELRRCECPKKERVFEISYGSKADAASTALDHVQKHTSVGIFSLADARGRVALMYYRDGDAPKAREQGRIAVGVFLSQSPNSDLLNFVIGILNSLAICEQLGLYSLGLEITSEKKARDWLRYADRTGLGKATYKGGTGSYWDRTSGGSFLLALFEKRGRFTAYVNGPQEALSGLEKELEGEGIDYKAIGIRLAQAIIRFEHNEPILQDDLIVLGLSFKAKQQLLHHAAQGTRVGAELHEASKVAIGIADTLSMFSSRLVLASNPEAHPDHFDGFIDDCDVVERIFLAKCRATPQSAWLYSGYLAMARTARFAFQCLSHAADSKWCPNDPYIYPNDLRVLPVHVRIDLLSQIIVLLQRHKKDFQSYAQMYIRSALEWRSWIVGMPLRRGLRSCLARRSLLMLQALRERCQDRGRDIDDYRALLAEAEDALGPARWLHEKIVAISGPAVIASLVSLEYASWPGIFRETGVILQLVRAESDLYLITTRVESNRVIQSRACKITGAAFLTGLREKYECTITAEIKVDNEARSLHELVREMSSIGGPVGELLGSSPGDVLIVCYDPDLLALPWSLLDVGGERLIERVTSLTFNISAGAAAALSRRGFDLSRPLDVAAYCYEGKEQSNETNREPLRWYEESSGLCQLQKQLGNRFVRREVTTEALNAYSTGDENSECAVLIVGGHGDALKGIELKDGLWVPSDLLETHWKLARTECTMLLSCDIGAMNWEVPNRVAGDELLDPSRSEIVGFAAGLCVAGIPRAIVCPWKAYDLQICRLISEIFRNSEGRRHDNEPHYWARAVRHVIGEGLRALDNDGCHGDDIGYYDLANLMLFGTP